MRIKKTILHFFALPLFLLLLSLCSGEIPKQKTFLPQSCSKSFLVFLSNFRPFYAKFGHGSKFSQGLIDLEAVKLWKGSEGDYEFAATIACMGAVETNYNSTYDQPGYKGWIGMKDNTCLVEWKRTHEIKKLTTKQKKELLEFLKENPVEADKLAASRLIYLTGHYKSLAAAIYTYYQGNKWRKNTMEGQIALSNCVIYFQSVLSLREQWFGIPTLEVY